MALHDSLSGVSRSGRVRKKSAKLMEMEDYHVPLFEPEHGFDVQQQQQQRNRKKPAAGSGKPGLGSPAGTGTAVISPPLPPSSPMPSFHSDSKTSNLNSLATAAAAVASKRKSVGTVPLPNILRGSAGLVTDRAMTTPKATQQMSTPFSTKPEQRVIAIKQFEPPTASFESLSGSAYLIGDDVHFITGEPIDSDAEDASDNRGYLSPLKIDVGGSGDDERTVAALQEESGLKMKFILSPKSPMKIDHSGKSKQPKKKKSASKSRSKRPPDEKVVSGRAKKEGKKSKKKQATGSGGGGMPVLEATAGRGGSAIGASFGVESDSGGDHDDESRLVIAEPPVLHPIKFSKSKKRSSGGSKSSASRTKKHGGREQSGSSLHVEGVGQQQSVYLKEKNSSKKKPSKKIAKAKDKTEIKTRPASAYMLWCREYRNRIVSESPGMGKYCKATFKRSDAIALCRPIGEVHFAAISRRLGEVWQSLSEFEKMKWRSKAKFLACRVPTSNVINTGKKTTEASLAPERVASSKMLSRVSVSSSKSDEGASATREVHRPVGTAPLDVAAYLKLLGESLSIIGQRLTEHEGQIAVSGSLSVLLDSTLCALGPLLCLTSEVGQLDGCEKVTQERILDNIAYIMPGL